MISVVVLTKDEERNIVACLEGARWADELLVLDSGSSDRTVELARSLGARVEFRPFTDYADQRNAALEMARGDWVFFLDADERITPKLREEIREAVLREGMAGWWVPRRNYIWGKWIRHAGWYPDYQLRLLRRGKARYDPRRKVHEIVILDGEAGYLQEPLVHYNYDTIAQFLEKQGRYLRYEAQILLEEGIRPKPYTYITQPLREFWRRYVSLQGYRDGWRGLLLSLLMAHYTFLAYLRLRELISGMRKTQG